MGTAQNAVNVINGVTITKKVLMQISIHSSRGILVKRPKTSKLPILNELLGNKDIISFIREKESSCVD